MSNDPNWLYSALAQSSAAIVGIIGAFVTHRVMSLGSEKRALQKEIESITIEISSLEKEREEVRKRLNDVVRERKQNEVADYLLGLLENEKLDDISSSEEVITTSLKDNKDFEIEVVEVVFPHVMKELKRVRDFLSKKVPDWYGDYPSIKQILREHEDRNLNEAILEIEYERAKDEYNSSMASSTPWGFLHSFSSPLAGIGVFPPKELLAARVIERAVRAPKPPEQVHEERINILVQSIKDKKGRKDILATQLRSISLPPYFSWGVLALLYLTIVGVIVPLILLPVSVEVHEQVKYVVIPLFLSGISFLFLYIALEINYIVKTGEIS